MEKQVAKAKEKSKQFKWSGDDALTLERETEQQEVSGGTLVLKFPDPELNENIIKGFSSKIESVEFEKPVTSRYCYVKLKKEASIDEVCKEISEITFGCIGKIVAEPKIVQFEETSNSENIDPYTLRIDNLPKVINIETLRERFPTFKRIYIDCDEKNLCYALIHFKTVSDAMESYERALDMSISSNKLVVKFKKVAEEQDDLKGSILENTRTKNNNNVETDSKGSVLEEACKLEENEINICFSNTIISEQIEIKEEIINEYEKEEMKNQTEYETDNWFNNTSSLQVKDEVVDESNDESVKDTDCYEDKMEYSEFESEVDEVDDTITFENVNESNSQNPVNSDHEELYNSSNDKKPDVNTILIDTNKSLLLVKDNSESEMKKSAMKRSSCLINELSMTPDNNENVIKDTNQIPIAKKKIGYRDELDELFEKMNSEDDDSFF